MKKITIFFILSLLASPVLSAVEENDKLYHFIENMANKHQFDRDKLKQLLDQVEIKQSILKAISRPAEGMPWYKYRKIFLTDSRIKGGVKFWQENQQTLAEVEQQYGVPAEIMIAIIGVETRYGQNTGSYRVIDALSTLGFAYPKRSKFFLSELENFLILTRQEKMNPLEPVGSYAGAMGMPQFMPSSYLSYAADFDQDGQRDIWNNTGDVLASIANYFNRHHWQKGEPVAFKVEASGERWKKALTNGLKPDVSVKQLKDWQVSVPQNLADDVQVKLLGFEQPEGQDLWVGLNNFYVITRYNHSPLYAMAVYQLSQAIAREYRAAAP